MTTIAVVVDRIVSTAIISVHKLLLLLLLFVFPFNKVSHSDILLSNGSTEELDFDDTFDDDL